MKWILIAFLIIIVVQRVVSIYNPLVEARNNAKNSFHTIDVIYLKIKGLLPQLEEIFQQSLSHDSKTSTLIGELRTKLNMNPGSFLSSSAIQIQSLMEDYSDFKSNDHAQILMESMSDLQDNLSHAQIVYNERATGYNIQIERFPDSMIASLFGFEKMDLITES